MAETGESWSYAELDDRANRLARVFRESGLEPGDHVAFCIDNRIEFLAAAWGAHYAGLIYTAVSTRLTPAETAFIVDDCGGRVFVAAADLAARAPDLPAQCPNVERWLAVGGTVEGYEPFEQVCEAASPSPLPDRVAGTDMLYSSGTTGVPKGVLRAPELDPLESAGTTVALILELLMGVDGSSVYLTPAPLYHAAPLRFSMAAHVLGATVVVMERFDERALLAAIERHRVTHTQLVPTMFVRLLRLPPDHRDRYDIASLVCAIHAAAPCPVDIKRQMIDWWGPIIQEYYAGTEGNGICWCDSEMWLAHPGTVGRPVNCEVHIVGEGGDELGPGRDGLVFFDGPRDFEYHGDPQKTAESRHERGWTTLGDIGRVDEEGFVYLTDRHADMIISGGVNIYPQEAENVLLAHPRVLDVAVFGVPDEDLGESALAVVVPVEVPDDDEARQRLATELMDHCRDRLSAFKCPRALEFRDELPRHPTGKLYKRLLRDEYWAGSDRVI